MQAGVRSVEKHVEAPARGRTTGRLALVWQCGDCGGRYGCRRPGLVFVLVLELPCEVEQSRSATSCVAVVLFHAVLLRWFVRPHKNSSDVA